MNWTCRSGPIADALVTWLNAGTRDWQTPTPQFVAVRTWAPEKTLQELDAGSLIVEVTPAAVSETDFLTRDRQTQDYTTLIVFRQHYSPPAGQPTVTTPPTAWVDGLVAIVEDVADALADPLQLTGQPSGFQVILQSAEIDPLCDGPSLLDTATFVAVIVVTWREYRTR